MRISKLLAFILSLPKTFYFNLSAFPLNKAIKLPVFSKRPKMTYCQEKI